MVENRNQVATFNHKPILFFTRRFFTIKTVIEFESKPREREKLEGKRPNSEPRNDIISFVYNFVLAWVRELEAGEDVKSGVEDEEVHHCFNPQN
jgi:hypothetical protein